MNTFAVILGGVVTSAALFYITSSMLLAQKQLMAATRLQAYLRYWGKWIIEKEMFPVFNIGREWSEEEAEVFRRHGGPAALVKLEAEKKQLVAQIAEQLKTRDLGFDQPKVTDLIRKLPKEAVSDLLDSAKCSRQNLILGQTFITDEEAATLGVAVAQSAIQLKMVLAELIDSGTMLMAQLISAPEMFDSKSVSEEAAKLLWPAVVAAHQSTSLLRHAQVFTTRTVMELTVRNVLSGSRLSKR